MALSRLRGISAGDKSNLDLALDLLSNASYDRDPSAVYSGDWRWTDSTKTPRKFMLPNHKIYSLLDEPGSDHERWNRHWDCMDSEVVWSTRWKKIWKSDLPFRGKLFLWRVIAQGLYTGNWAGLMGYESECIMCPGCSESIEHLFTRCRHALRVWNAQSVYYEGTEAAFAFGAPLNLPTTNDLCLPKRPRETAQLFLLYLALWDLWTERNNQTFNGSTRFHKPNLTSRAADDAIFALCTKLPPGKKLERLRCARTWLKIANGDP